MPIVTPDDPLIVVPPGKPKGWRPYSVQPNPSEAQMEAASSTLKQLGFEHDWWISGRGVFLVDARPELDRKVIAAIEAGWAAPAQATADYER